MHNIYVYIIKTMML